MSQTGRRAAGAVRRGLAALAMGEGWGDALLFGVILPLALVIMLALVLVMTPFILLLELADLSRP